MQIRVTSEAAGSPASARASAARIRVPPRLRVPNSSKTETSKLIEVEARTPAISSAEKCPAAQRSMATALRWVMATPLGRPVEPEVKMK